MDAPMPEDSDKQRHSRQQIDDQFELLVGHSLLLHVLQQEQGFES